MCVKSEIERIVYKAVIRETLECWGLNIILQSKKAFPEVVYTILSRVGGSDALLFKIFFLKKDRILNMILILFLLSILYVYTVRLDYIHQRLIPSIFA